MAFNSIPVPKTSLGVTENLLLKSRIVLVFFSSSFFQFVKEVNHLYALLTDHKLIMLKLSATKEISGFRRYWKLNNSLLNDDPFIG